MSALPREIASPERRPAPSRRVSPSPPAAARPSVPAAPARARRARRGPQIGFAVLAALVVGALVVGLVALNALMAQAAFRRAELEARVGDLRAERAALVAEAAHLSSPRAVAAWAEANGFVVAPSPAIVSVPARTGDDVGRSPGLASTGAGA